MQPDLRPVRATGLTQPPPVGWQALRQRLLSWTLTVLSVLPCLLLLPARLPGMELLGIAPNWLLVWVVAWSIKRSVWEGAVAGVTLGLLQDGMSAAVPTHAISLGIVGMLTARLQRERVVQDDIISVLLIVFGMTVVGETIRALQFSLYAWRLPASAVFWSFEEIWRYYQQVALGSAVLNSLWSPVIYYPLNLLWEHRFTSN